MAYDLSTHVWWPWLRSSLLCFGAAAFQVCNFGGKDAASYIEILEVLGGSSCPHSPYSSEQCGAGCLEGRFFAQR